MPPAPVVEYWAETRTWVSWGITIASFVFGLWCFRHNRRENRLDALTKILQPMADCFQKLHGANNYRLRCEQIKHSFPNAPENSEPVKQVSMLVEQYGAQLKQAQAAYYTAQSDLASRSFRFPDKVAHMLQKAKEALAEYARLVNEGMFDKADFQAAKFQDDYRLLVKTGRGWRLADPFEGVKRYFQKAGPKEEEKDRWDIGPKEMASIMELLQKRVTSQREKNFAVHPPKKLLDNPELKKSDRVIEELEDSVFSVVFQDGTARMMTLPELMVLTYNLIMYAHQEAEVVRMMQAGQAPPTTISVTFRMSVDDIMRTEMVKLLLTKLEFEKTASDGDRTDAPPGAA